MTGHHCNVDSENRPAPGLLEDISPSGACLQMETDVPLEAEIRWASPQQPFAGRVRYCVYREIGYFVGVEFEPESRWSKKTYQPQHLLDLQQLMRRGKRSAHRNRQKTISHR